MENVKSQILTRFNDDSSLSQALRYFAEVTLHKPLPVFPALINMSCEAVGGNPEKAAPFAEAIVFISAAADLHDDVIDQSTQKNGNQTVLGKYGAVTAILAGDTLLSEGFKRLSEAGGQVSKKNFEEILQLVNDSIFGICKAENLEAQSHRKTDLRPDEFMEIAKLKAVVPELSMKIGAVLGGARLEDIEALGQFGRAYGVATIIAEEFADLLEFNEFKSRLKNECPPLPVVYALQNAQIKKTLLPLLDTEALSKTTHRAIVEIVLESEEVNLLQKTFVSEAKVATKKLPKPINGKNREELENLLLVPLAYFE